ncbi:MAG: cyclodeaminase/cyclohydrolase family protein [Clostridiaceae bacterium]
MSFAEVFNKIIDSNDATAGGGSASAVAGAMAAGMAGMVARLSQKKDYGFSPEKYGEIAHELDLLADDLVEGAEKDYKAFCRIKDAYGLPKTNEAEKAERSEAIQVAGINAAAVPRDNGFLCKRVYELAKSIEGKSNPNAGSDLAMALILAKAGIKGCIMNIEANLPLIKDENIKSEFEKQIKILSNA